MAFSLRARIVFPVDSPPIENLYARLGKARPNFCFAGHTDVVPAGDAALWRHDPFAAHIAGGMLYGRGAADMKSAIAAFAAAVALTLLVPAAPARRAPRDAVATQGGPAARSFAPASNKRPAGELLPKAGGTKTYPADATIYDLGSGAGEPRVVWIVDRSLDI